jgi:phage-related protein
MALGDAFIDVHANTDPFEKDLRTKLPTAAKDANSIMDQIGEGWGDKVASSMTKELGSHGKDFAQAVERSTERTVIHPRSDIKWDANVGRFRNSAGEFVAMFADETQKAFQRQAGPGGPFAKVGEAFSDAVGAGFSVSGKSPLIALLIPLVGEIGLLIAGALQGANALAAVLTTLPALITAVGLQATVLFAAFHGIGDAIQGAFAAKNAQELNDAIKGLTPAAQSFVVSLLPVRDLFKEISAIAQQNFFKQLGDTAGQVARALGPILTGNNFAALARSLGDLFAGVGVLLRSPLFSDFINNTLKQTVIWLREFGLAFTNALTGLVRIANASLPFLRTIGGWINEALNEFGDWLGEVATNGSFSAWLKSMTPTFLQLLELLKAVAKFVGAFFFALDKAGGEDALSEIIGQLMVFAAILSSDFGIEAMRGLLFVLGTLGIVFMGLATAIMAAAALISVAYRSIREFFIWLIDYAAPAVGQAFEEAWFRLQLAWAGIVNGLQNLGKSIGDFFVGLWNSIKNNWNRIIGIFLSVPMMIWNALKGLPSLLWNAGKNAVNSFLDGVKSMFGAVGNVAHDLISKVTDLLPGSPAKEGPLSGHGYAKLRGQRMVQDLMVGMKGQATDLRNTATNTVSQVVNFGGIKMEFGGVPTEAQARTAGAAVGAGITNQMEVALAVRAL